MVAAADQRLAEVDRVVTVAVVGPAGEGVALAGRGQGLAGDAVAVGNALERLVAVEERAAVGDVEDVDGVVLDDHVPLGEQGGVVAAADQRLAEVDRVVTVAVVGPAGEGVALAGRGQGLAGDAVAVSDTLHGLIAIGKSATIGNIENRLLVVLLPLSINSRVTAARNDSLREVDGVISVAIVRPTKEVIALAGRLKRQACDTVGIGYALHSIVTVEERTAVGDVEDFDSLVLLRGRPSGEKGHILAATDNRLVEVNRVGSIAVIIPTGKHIAVTRGGKRLASNTIAVSLALHNIVAVGELAAIGSVGHIKHLRGSLSPLGEQHEVIRAALERLREIDYLIGSGINPASKHIAVTHWCSRRSDLAVLVRVVILPIASVRKSTAVGIVVDSLASSGSSGRLPVCTLGTLRRDSSNRRGAEHHTQAQTGCDSSVKLPIHVVVLSRLASSRPLRRRRPLNCIIYSSRKKTQKVAQPSYI